MQKQLMSTISKKGQTTIPSEVRKLLHLDHGDVIKYEVEEKGVRIQKIDGIDLKWAKAIESTLTEWSGPEDDDL